MTFFWSIPCQAHYLYLGVPYKATQRAEAACHYDYLYNNWRKVDTLAIRSYPKYCRQQDFAPLLFIPFLENSFKHGVNSNIEAGWINISLAES